jgi:hypothetical protein
MVSNCTICCTLLLSIKYAFYPLNLFTVPCINSNPVYLAFNRYFQRHSYSMISILMSGYCILTAPPESALN